MPGLVLVCGEGSGLSSRQALCVMISSIHYLLGNLIPELVCYESVIAVDVARWV